MTATVAALLLLSSLDYNLVGASIDYVVVTPGDYVLVQVEAIVSPVSLPPVPPVSTVSPSVARAASEADAAAVPPQAPPAQPRSACPNGQCPTRANYQPRYRRR